MSSKDDAGCSGAEQNGARVRCSHITDVCTVVETEWVTDGKARANSKKNDGRRARGGVMGTSNRERKLRPDVGFIYPFSLHPLLRGCLPDHLPVQKRLENKLENRSACTVGGAPSAALAISGKRTSVYESGACGQTPSASAVHRGRKASASTSAGGRSVRIGAGRGGKDERRSRGRRVTRADLRGAFWNSRRRAHSHHVSGKKNHLCIVPREPARRAHGSGHRASGKSGSRRCGTAGGGRERRCFDAVWLPRASHNPRG